MEISTNYLSEIETKKGWGSPYSLAKMANALEIEVFELFKPQETVKIDDLNIVNKCLEDFAASVRISFEKSLLDSMKKIRKTL